MKLFKNNWTKPYMLLLPSIVVILTLIGYSLIMALGESMSNSPSLLLNYEKVFENNSFKSSLAVSVKVAAISTIFSLVIGILLTRMLHSLFKNDFWKYIVWFPMLIPHFVGAYLILLLFSQSGWFSSILFELGFIREIQSFPIFVQDTSYVGVILSYMWKEIPFVILMLLPGYQEMDHRHKDVVKTLGGNQWDVWKSVELPRLWPTILETGIILFTFILAAFEIPALLGVTFPKMLPLLAYEWFYQGDWSNRPMAQALMVSVSIVTVTLSIIVIRIAEQWRKRFRVRR